MQHDGHPEDAIRQIQYWFTYFIDSFVSSRRTAPRVAVLAGVGVVDAPTPAQGLRPLDRHPRPINADALAQAHHETWRHAIVRAQKSANRADWASMTDVDASEAYFDLVKWTCGKYRLGLDSVLSALTEMGYRHDTR